MNKFGTVEFPLEKQTVVVKITTRIEGSDERMRVGFDTLSKFIDIVNELNKNSNGYNFKLDYQY